MRTQQSKAAMRRVLAGIVSVLAVSAGACALRESTAPTSGPASTNDLAARVTPARSHLAVLSGTVSTDPTDAHGTVDLGIYATPTIVDVTMSGTITRTNKYNTSLVDNIGPGGYNNCQSGATVLRWNGGGGNFWVTNNCQNGLATVSGVATVTGAVYADRGAMSTSCAQGASPCFTYTPGVTVTVTPRSGTLTLTCTPSEITAKSTVNCTLVSSLPSTTSGISHYWSEGGPWSGPVCGGGTTCTMNNREYTGTLTATALVNGEVKTASATVKRRCITGDTVFDANADRRNRLAAVWTAGGDRDSTGAVIPFDNRREVGSLGLPGTVWRPMELGDIGRCFLNWTSAGPGGFSDYIHSHPWPGGTLRPLTCWNPAAGPGTAPVGYGLSAADAVSASQTSVETGTAFRIFSIDRDSIFYISGADVGPIDTTISASGQMQFTPHDTTWSTRQRRIGRTGPFACVLP